MLKGPVARATLRTSVVMLVRLGLQAGSLFLVARVLGPPLFGAYVGTAALAILLGTLTTFGTPLVLLAEASRAYRRRLRVLPYCVSTSLIVGSFLFPLFIALDAILFAGSPVSLPLVAVIGATELFVQPLLRLPSAQLQARHRVVASQFVMLVPQALRFLLVLSIALQPVRSPLTVFLIGSLLAGIIGLLVATKLTPGAWPAFRHWRLATIPELRRAAGFAVLTITSTGPSEIDKSLAARLLPLATAGVYSGAARVISAVSLPVNAMIHAVLPTLFREAGETKGIRPKMLATMFAATFFYGTGIAIAMWLAVPLITWAFGSAYVGIGQAVGWLCIAIPGTMLRMSGGAILLARGRPWQRVSCEMAGLASIVILAIYLVPDYGISGMIAAYVIAEWLMACYSIGLVIKHGRRTG